MADLLNTLVPALLLAFLHRWATRLHPDKYIDRKYWLSFADGVSITYIFLGLLPEIMTLAEQRQAAFDAGEPQVFIALPDRLSGWADHYPFLPLLIGFTVFYGLQRWIDQPRATPSHEGDHRRSRFWAHIIGISIYKFLLGYLLAQMGSPSTIIFFTAAIAMHFLVIDFRIIEMHQRAYLKIGRWALASAFLLGWTISAVVAIDPSLLAMLISFVAGGAILLVIQDEFSESHSTSFAAFVLALILYAALLLQF